MTDSVLAARDGAVLTVTLNRPDRRNAVDRETADALAHAFADFDADDSLSVAVLTGAGGNCCAGADLKALSDGHGNRVEPVDETAPDYRPIVNGPMGPTRMMLAKPVIAAVEGPAVAGGLELALWCDMRVAARNAIFGVYCRRFGVPLIDGGTVRLPRLVGEARALDMILTGRAVGAEEAHAWGLVSRLADPGGALDAATALAKELAALPQTCLRNDRASALRQWGLSERAALAQEFAFGLRTLESGETVKGAARFAQGEGRGGKRVE